MTSPDLWCDTCQSWRYTAPCGRDDCPHEETAREAIAALDPNEPDHERIDVRDWLKEARRILGR